MSKPTFLTIRADTRFRNENHRSDQWRAYLNGEPVEAIEADTIRGYVDVINVEKMRENHFAKAVIDRLFGKVELRHRGEVWKRYPWATNE